MTSFYDNSMNAVQSCRVVFSAEAGDQWHCYIAARPERRTPYAANTLLHH